MSTREDEFREQLRATFRVEAGEHVRVIGTSLLKLEKSPAANEQRHLVETAFRAAHSLKGAARAVNFTEIESICQSLEDVFASWKRQESAPSPAEMDKLHRALNTIAAALAAPGVSRGAETSALARLDAAPPGAAPVKVGPPPAPGTAETASRDETVRIAVAKLDARLLQAEEMLTAKLATGQRVDELRELAGRFDAWRKEWGAVEPEARALRQALDRAAPGRAESRVTPRMAGLLEFFDWNLDYFKSVETQVAALTRTAEQDRHVVGKLVDDLLEDSKKLLMLPFATLTVLFPKLVRDLSRDQGKEVDLAIRGEEIEIDKRILEEMKDPFIHILRNCVDHGVETPEQRKQSGKPPRASITLAVSRLNGNKVELLVSDDGAGIDTDKVKESAVRHGLIPAAEARRLGESEALNLIFQAEVSTSPIITQLSGRGLGLAIVREKTEKLGGAVSIESRRHAGTTVRITLPVTVATFRGVLVEAAEQLFVVPTAQVERVARVRAEDIQTVEGRETISLDGRAVALARLADVLEIARPARSGEANAVAPVVILGAGEQRIAFAVDAVQDEHEVLVKQLGKPLARMRNIAGATVLGSGRVAPILNVADLLKSARKHGGAATRVAAGPTPRKVDVKSILVVEDSITSRMLLKGILESAGYKVKTAVDGVDAFTALRAEQFDLVVSDVEMPRLNGFDLTARIRADRKLADMPVVLVTALETREDRERGIDVGANAYLVKSSFDQSNLLEAVRRLI